MFLELKNINFKYNNFSLKKINFSFKKNWVYLISWPSWSWKSTLLKIIWWFLKINSWEILFKQKNLYSLNKKDFLEYKQKIIGFSYQKLNLINNLTIKENIELKAKIENLKIDKKWEKYLLEYFELSNLENKKITEISWWQALRVSIIKSLILKPKILLLDEPESWLDKRLTKKLINFEKKYAKNNLVIISSHYFDNKKDSLNIEKLDL